jgi:hypothetical protein
LSALLTAFLATRKAYLSAALKSFDNCVYGARLQGNWVDLATQNRLAMWTRISDSPEFVFERIARLQLKAPNMTNKFLTLRTFTCHLHASNEKGLSASPHHAAPGRKTQQELSEPWGPCHADGPE